MERIAKVVSILSLICWASVLVTAQEPSVKLYAGGPSEIDSRDPDRAKKAIDKWTRASEDDDQWDPSVVGRPTFLRVVKNSNHDGILEVWLKNPSSRRYELFRKYKIAYFSGQLGPKTAEGDLQAPEGFYFISKGRMNPKSRYHLSMDIGYPNAYDKAHDRTGDYLMIHGKAASLGCFAMTDRSAEQLYTLVDQALAKGQSIVRVHCFPFEMTEANLAKHQKHEYHSFWRNLKEGWDWFEEHRVPPNVEVDDGEYVFDPGS
ncbi:MAG: L,D-transpeptidase family protein [Verrucomicrobiota bacterium]